MSDSRIAVDTQAGVLVVLLAVHVGRVREGAVCAARGTATTLIRKVPVEAGERAMLGALVLAEGRTRIHAELVQVSEWGFERVGRDRRRGTYRECCGFSPVTTSEGVGDLPSINPHLITGEIGEIGESNAFGNYLLIS